MPQRCVDAFRALWDDRTCTHAHRAECDCLVFTSRVGTPLDAHNVRSDFRKVAEAAGLMAGEWTSLTSDGIRIAVFYTKIYNRLLVPLTAANHAPAPRTPRRNIGHHPPRRRLRQPRAPSPHRLNLDAMKEREAPLLHRIKNLAGSSCVASGSLSGRPVALSSSGELL
jgi:hypothetical protein